MIIKRFLIFTVFCFGINICQAENFITFDTAALDTAMNEITRVGSDSPYKTVEEAGDALYDAFYAAKKNNTVDSDLVMDKCFNEIIKSGRICNNFINAYDKYLNKANYCLKANREKIIKDYNLPGEANQQEYNFQECLSAASAAHNYNKDKGYVEKTYTGTSYIGKCVDWVKAAEQCQTYLISYYKDKLDNSGISESDKKYYECLLEKVQTGNMDFPMSKMEQSCK